MEGLKNIMEDAVEYQIGRASCRERVYTPV